MNNTSIRLKDLAGLLTEWSAWRLLYDLTDGSSSVSAELLTPENIVYDGQKQFKIDVRTKDLQANSAFLAPEFVEGSDNAASIVWTIGALSFYALMGVDVFEGKGGATQTAATEVPRIGSTHASHDLSDIIYKCMSYEPSARPSLAEIHDLAAEALKRKAAPRKRITDASGRSYSASLVAFWPEEMATVLLFALLWLSPLNVMGQGRIEVPNEMGNLVRSCVSLRSPSNKATVQRQLERDTKWTMMDEIAVDRQGECTTKDPVAMFGLNSIGFRILKLHGGVTNTGGRFRDGRDPRYKYSFIEITVKRGSTVNYNITGREGSQLFAVIPHAANAAFGATLTRGGRSVGKETRQDGVCYLSLKSGLKKSDVFRLSISNRSGKNMSFVIINYNSRDHE